MTLGRTSSGAIKIKTDEAGGGLRAVSCGCCTPPVEDFQSFFKRHDWDECPGAGKCGSEEGEESSCSGLSVSGELRSIIYPASLLITRTPRAEVFARFDNFGWIGDISDRLDVPEHDECEERSISGTVTPGIEVVDSGVTLVLPFLAKNAAHGGPYGIDTFARFYWE